MSDMSSLIKISGALVTIKKKTEKADVTGAVIANAPTSTVFKTDLTEATDDYYKDMQLRFTSGLVGETSIITAYVGSSKQITVSPAFSVAPSVTDAFIIEGPYGDSPIIWTAESSQEYVWIQAATSVRSADVLKTLAGNIDVSDYLGYLLPDTVIVTEDILEAGSTRYKVGRILSMPLIGTVSHKEAHLSLMEEGT